MKRILVVEDNSDLAANLTEFLSPDYSVEVARDGESGLKAALAESADVIILDLTLPRLDGLEVCRRLRAAPVRQPPVLMLTARDTIEDKLAGFDAGADDYLVKPFALRELGARAGVLLRRHGSEAETHPGAAGVLRVADLELDPGTLEVRRGTERLRIHRIAMRILEELLRASPNVVRREDLEARVWDGHRVSESVLRTHVWGLRRAVDGERPEDQKLIHTVHGIGYRLAEDRSE